MTAEGWREGAPVGENPPMSKAQVGRSTAESGAEGGQASSLAKTRVGVSILYSLWSVPLFRGGSLGSRENHRNVTVSRA